MAEVDAVAGEHLSEFETEQEKREAFRVIENHMANRYDLEIDSEAPAKTRAPLGRPRWDSVQSPISRAPSDQNTPDDEYFLGCEFVAIYW